MQDRDEVRMIGEIPVATFDTSAHSELVDDSRSRLALGGLSVEVFQAFAPIHRIALTSLRKRISQNWDHFLLLILCAAMVGCQARRDKAAIAIEFTKIPPAAQGGRERVDTVAGRAVGARAGQQIVVYARSGPWWVQPWPDNALIPIQSDSTWSTSTHLGFEYAALLVDPGYHPPPTMDVAPTPGGSVVSVMIVKGTGTTELAPTKPLQFSGYDWKVRTIASDRGGLNNPYGGDSAWTDEKGALHLRIKKTPEGRWSCAEVVLTRSLGYGTYITVIHDTSHLEPAAVLSMTTFDGWGGTSITAKWTSNTANGATLRVRTIRNMGFSLSMFPATRRPSLRLRERSLSRCIGNLGALVLKLFAEPLPMETDRLLPNTSSPPVSLHPARRPSNSCSML